MPGLPLQKIVKKLYIVSRLFVKVYNLYDNKHPALAQQPALPADWRAGLAIMGLLAILTFFDIFLKWQPWQP